MYWRGPASKQATTTIIIINQTTITSTATATPPRIFLMALMSFVCCCCCKPVAGVLLRWRRRRGVERWGITLLPLYLPLASIAEAAPSCNLLSWLNGTMVRIAGVWGSPSESGWSIAMPVEYTERSCRSEGDRPEQDVLHLQKWKSISY